MMTVRTSGRRSANGCRGAKPPIAGVCPIRWPAASEPEGTPSSRTAPSAADPECGTGVGGATDGDCGTAWWAAAGLLGAGVRGCTVSPSRGRSGPGTPDAVCTGTASWAGAVGSPDLGVVRSEVARCAGGGPGCCDTDRADGGPAESAADGEESRFAGSKWVEGWSLTRSGEDRPVADGASP